MHIHSALPPHPDSAGLETAQFFPFAGACVVEGPGAERIATANCNPSLFNLIEGHCQISASSRFAQWAVLTGDPITAKAF